VRKRLTIVVALIGLLATAGIAMAAEEEPEDTIFNYGYDQENQVFLWGAHANDGLYDCSLDVKGPLIATYGLTTDGLVEVAGLHDGDDVVVTFNPTPEEDLADEFEEPAGEPVEYTGPDGECVVGGGEVAGPNGQVNHGMFMKLFNSQYEGKARGCVVRYLAKSGLGKGDQQVKVADVDPEAESVQAGDTGEVEFATALADCERGKADKEDKVTGQDKAAAKKAEKADKTRGKSSEAPGKNKTP